MKKAIIYGLIFLAMPVVFVIMAIIHRPPTFEGKMIADWFDEIKTGQPSSSLAAFQKMGSAAVPLLHKGVSPALDIKVGDS